MEMMLSVINNFLSKNEKATFNQIFLEIKSILKDRWKNRFPNLSIIEIETKKKGELFSYLNTDGRFIRLDDEYWALTHNYSYKEIRKMRASISENKE